MYLRGVMQGDIAKELQLSHATVSRDLALLQKEWQTARLYDMNEAKNKELARIDVLERTYWDGWERSKLDAEAETEAISSPGNTVLLHSSRGQNGDPRFLQGIMTCIERRCSILGIDAPKRADLTSGGEKMSWAKFVNARVIVMNQPQAQLPDPDSSAALLPDEKLVDAATTDS
jgi:hypothetical protein